MVVFPVLLNVWAVFAGLFALQIFWMSFIPLLLEIVLGNLAVPVHTVTAWRSMEDLAAALGASVVTASCLVVEANTSRTLLLNRRRARGLHVSGVAEHGHLDADFGDAVLIFVIVYRAGTRSHRRTRAGTVGSLVLWHKLLAKASSLSL